jgi:hypothetical protein
MSQEVRPAELRDKSQQLVNGPLKHIRAAALAAALVPLASVLVTPASAQSSGCVNSGGVCGTVFNDVNHDGIQQAGEPGIAGVEVDVFDATTNTTFPLFTDSNGYFEAPTGSVTVGDLVTLTTAVPSYQVSQIPANCFDGCNAGHLQNGVSVISGNANNHTTNFGFFQSSAANPGTGTIGSWKTHPQVWPPAGVMVAGTTYYAATAIPLFNKVGKDKSYMMFAQLVAAKLSVQIGNDSSCIAPTIAAADAWLAHYGIGTNIAGSSDAWSGSGNGAVLEATLDAYNNGQLCAPHRQ